MLLTSRLRRNQGQRNILACTESNRCRTYCTDRITGLPYWQKLPCKAYSVLHVMVLLLKYWLWSHYVVVYPCICSFLPTKQYVVQLIYWHASCDIPNARLLASRWPGLAVGIVRVCPRFGNDFNTSHVWLERLGWVGLTPTLIFVWLEEWGYEGCVWHICACGCAASAVVVQVNQILWWIRDFL